MEKEQQPKSWYNAATRSPEEKQPAPSKPSPALERAKIQAQVLVPVLKAFREELGAERANRIAWKALAEWRQQVIAEEPRLFGDDLLAPFRERFPSDSIGALCSELLTECFQDRNQNLGLNFSPLERRTRFGRRRLLLLRRPGCSIVPGLGLLFFFHRSPPSLLFSKEAGLDTLIEPQLGATVDVVQYPTGDPPVFASSPQGSHHGLDVLVHAERVGRVVF